MIEILQVGPYPEWDEAPLNDAYKVHRYFEAEDGAAFLAEHGAGVRGIATRGELGADAAMIAALPRLEVISGGQGPLSAEIAHAWPQGGRAGAGAHRL